MIQLFSDHSVVHLTWNNLTAELPASEIKFAQFGCKVLRKLIKKMETFPKELLRFWDERCGRRKAWAGN